MEVGSRYERLFAWARSNGGFIHSDLKLVQTDDRGVECTVDDESGGIDRHEVFMRVHYRLSLSYWNAVSAGKESDSYYQPHSRSLPKELLESSADHETVSALFLVQQYLLGEESFWHPYIQILPQPRDACDPAIPLLWSKEDLRWLSGTYLEEEVVKKRKDLESRWSEAVNLMSRDGSDISTYTFDLFLWAHYIFVTRSFSTLAIEGDSAAIKDEYQIIFKSGACIDDVPKVLMPVLDLLNHDQRAGMGYDFKDTGLGLRKATALKPGEGIGNPYDKDTQRYNNTSLLKDFGFILSDNEFPEAVLPLPFDIAQPAHPSHAIFSTSSTSDEYYASSEEIRLAFVTVRAPCRHPLGLMNPSHEARALRHFHPKLVSMVSFKVATLIERAALRNDPYTMPSRRNQQATIDFLETHARKILHDLRAAVDGLEPTNYRQAITQKYRLEQATILEDVLRDMAVPSDLFFVGDDQ